MTDSFIIEEIPGAPTSSSDDNQDGAPVVSKEITAGELRHSDSRLSSRSSGASSGYFSDISGRFSDDPELLEHIKETIKNEEHGDQSDDKDDKPQSPELPEAPGQEFAQFQMAVDDVSSTDNDGFNRENSSADLALDSSGNPCRSSSSSGTSGDAPSYCLCVSSISPSHSFCSGRHADVMATQECEQDDITDCFPSSVYSGQEIERWLDSTRVELGIGPSLFTPPYDTDQSHDNLDVHGPPDSQTTNECPPSATFDVILDCQSCLPITEQEICRQLSDNLERFREHLSDVGDLKSVNEGCIILTFKVNSDKERENIRKAVQDGTLKKKIEAWLQNNNQQQDFNLGLSISAQEETKAILDRPVKFAFCQCEKHWYWSCDQVQWFSVRIHEISREERVWRPLPADLSLMQRLVSCDQSPNQVKGKTCLICMTKKHDPTKVLENENRKNDTIDITINGVNTGQNGVKKPVVDKNTLGRNNKVALYINSTGTANEYANTLSGDTSLSHRLLSSEGSGSSGYDSQYSSLSEEDTPFYLNAEEEDKTVTVDSSV